MLSRDPPNWVFRAAAWLVIGIFAAGLLALVLVRVPETIRCPCLLGPEAGADPIQAPRAAVVRQVRIQEGRAVAAGEELFVLSSEDVDDRDAQARSLDADLALRRNDLKRAEVTDAADLQIKDHEIAQTDEEIRFRGATLEVERDLASRVEKLLKLGIYAETDLILRRLEVTGAEKDLSVAQRTRQQLVLQRQQMANEQERQRSDRLADIKKIEIRLGSLSRQLGDSDQNLVSIRAPYDAVVISMAENNPGSIVQQGQELCQLARTSGKLRLRLLLSEPAMSRLAVGQRVRFLAEAFPFQRYGTITGTITWISPSAVSSRDGGQFIAAAQLDRDTIQVGGQALPLRAGMRGEARVVVGSRTPIEYVLEPIRQLRENMAGSPR